MATYPVYLQIGDFSGDSSLAIVYTHSNNFVGLGGGEDDFEDGARGWQWNQRGTSAYSQEVGGVLDISLTGSGARESGYQNNRVAAYPVTGDFDCQVSFSEFTVSVSQVGSQFFAQLRIFSTSTFNAFIARQYVESEGDRFRVVINGTTKNFTAASSGSGILRIARIGESLSFVYDDGGGGLKSLWSEPVWDGGAVYWAIYGQSNNSDIQGHVKFDDYMCNDDGCVFPTTSPQTARYENSLPAMVLDMSTLEISAIGTGTPKYQYAVDGGALNGTWLTIAALQAVSDVTVGSSFAIVAQFVSNGTQSIIIPTRALVDGIVTDTNGGSIFGGDVCT